MAETSYIIQNGRRLDLKDSTARKSIGSCSGLKTDTKHCLVDAVNELCEKITEGGAQGEPGKDGVSVTHEWNGTVLTVTSASGTSSADLKGEKGDKGAAGIRGTGIYRVTTAPSSYTTEQGGFTPTYRISLSTVLSQSGATEILVGDNIRYSYYLYPVGYVSGSYVYTGARVSIRGSTGATGADGADGVSCAHEWDGTVLTVTSASGTSSADLKGEQGGRGPQGDQGPKGDTGASGVYIGTTAPTDSNVTVWVNPDYTGQAEAFAAITADTIRAICT